MPSVEELSAQLAHARAEIESLKNQNAFLENKAKDQAALMSQVGEKIREAIEMLP